MWKMSLLGLLLLTWSLSLSYDVQAAAKAKPDKTIYANADAHGVHTGTAAISGPAAITCINATNGGVDPTSPNNRPATCYITAPGYHGDLTIGQQAGASGAGTVTLSCDGYPYPLNCSARISQ